MPENSPTFKKFYAISLAWQLGFLISFSLIGFGALGYFLDHKLATFPLLSLIGLGIGIITSIFETYHMLVPIIKQEGSDAHH